jgi:hypothetical protein
VLSGFSLTAFDDDKYKQAFESALAQQMGLIESQVTVTDVNVCDQDHQWEQAQARQARRRGDSPME